MKNFFLSIVASIGSLFGIHSQPVQTIPVAPTAMIQTQDDQASKVDTVDTIASSTVSASASSSLSSFTHASGIYSFSYPKNAVVDPHLYMIIGSKGGLQPLPKSTNPNNVFIPSDPGAFKQEGVSVDLTGPASAIRANFIVLPEVNGQILNKVGIVTSGSNATLFSSKKIGGFSTKVYDLSTATQSRKVYEVDLGHTTAVSLSLVILETATAVPSLSENTTAIENIINSISIDAATVQKFIQGYGTQKAKASDAVNISRILQARVEAEVYWTKPNSYSGFCTTDAQLATIKASLPSGSVSCKDSATAYALSVQISNGYFCVDSTGKTVQHATKPAMDTFCGN